MSAASQILETLSPDQHRAAHHTQSPALVLAGAGSGKTRTMIARVAHLCTPRNFGGLGADPSSIVMVTFTNKAGREMRERLAPIMEDLRERFSISPGMPWTGTFHGISLKVLKIEARRANLGKNFVIYDTSDSKEVLKEVLKDTGMGADPDEFLRDLDFAKSIIMSPDQVDRLETRLKGGDQSARRVLDRIQTPNFSAIYRHYQQALQSQNAVDFSDIINRATTLFRQHPDVLLSWQSSWRHFIVDEVQDINRAQMVWLETITNGCKPHDPDLISSLSDNTGAEASDGMQEVNGYRLRSFPKPTLAAVGDDDQSIYAFRGSEPGLLRMLNRRMNGMTRIDMGETYRCQPYIIDAANALIGQNTDRLGKQMRPADNVPRSEALKIMKSGSWSSEVASLTEGIRSKISGGIAPSEIAVLLRTQTLVKEVAKQLRMEGIPAQAGKGADFRKSEEAADVFAWANFILSPNSEVPLRRIINKPARRLGPTSIGRVFEAARAKSVTFSEEIGALMRGNENGHPANGSVPDGVVQPYKSAFLRDISAFGGLVSDIRSDVDRAGSARDALTSILERSGYLASRKEEALNSLEMYIDGRFSNAKSPSEREAKDACYSKMKAIRDRIRTISPREFMDSVIDVVSPRKEGDSEDTRSLEDKADHMSHISDAMRRVATIGLILDMAEPYESLQDFMHEQTLESEASNNNDMVQVLTVHASKGLEWDHVYLPAMVQGVFPHKRSLDEQSAEEGGGVPEERRLAYVALTRARKSVSISWSGSMPKHLGGDFHGAAKKSEFIIDLERLSPQVIETNDKPRPSMQERMRQRRSNLGNNGSGRRPQSEEKDSRPQGKSPIEDFVSKHVEMPRVSKEKDAGRECHAELEKSPTEDFSDVPF